VGDGSGFIQNGVGSDANFHPFFEEHLQNARSGYTP
jgi:hypothetical protein